MIITSKSDLIRLVFEKDSLVATGNMNKKWVGLEKKKGLSIWSRPKVIRACVKARILMSEKRFKSFQEVS